MAKLTDFADNPNSNNLSDEQKLRWNYDLKQYKDYDQMKYELRFIFKFLDAMGAKDVRVEIEDSPKQPDDLEFRPTLGAPDVSFSLKGERYSAWYKPTFYVAEADSVRKLVADFVFLKGQHSSMYSRDEHLLKMLTSYEFLTPSMLKDVSSRLLSRLHKVQLVALCKELFAPSHSSDLKAVQYYLNPARILLVSEAKIPDALKTELPPWTRCIEAFSTNPQKLKEIAGTLF